jgi:anti-sigma B factor antagonist
MVDFDSLCCIIAKACDEEAWSMEIATQEYKKVAVMSVSGRVDSSTAPELESQLKLLVDGGQNHLVLDLKDVEYMSSAGLRAMVSTLKSVKRVNGDLRLANPSARVEEVLRLAGLTSIFSIHPTQEEAVASF